MARNIEIKTRISNMDEMLIRVSGLADHGPIEILQDDTFFLCSNGRLKLRILSEKEGQLIFYKRLDRSGPKESFYIISRTTSPDTLRDVLTTAFRKPETRNSNIETNQKFKCSKPANRKIQKPR